MEKREPFPDALFPGLASLRGGGIEIVAVEGVDKGKIWRLEQLPVVIGRAPENEIHSPLDRKMSRQHARLTKAENRYFLEDLGSTNGTFLRGTKLVGQAELFHGEHFICGGATFRFGVKDQDLPREDATVVVSSRESSTSSIAATYLREAIVVLDMCNSSALASQFGDEQAMLVKRELRRHYLPVVRRWGAQFVKNTGDGYLVTFTQARDAVAASVETLQHLRDYNATAPPNAQLRLRFGLNYGETMVDADGDRHGNAVNITFRVEGVREENRPEASSEAPPLRPEDRIYLTEGMYAELPPTVQVACRPLGHFVLKGIVEPHLLYEVPWNDLDSTQVEGEPP
ncbi:MAG: FHA domain-containing protein [Deltaproteobacteria bacterium]|nr:FHA domain-containing protein [Deltaproteobacteria bacterium]